MASIQLPPELHDIIIDYFHDDPAMLARCALVSRSWLPAVRFHSWRRLSLKCTTAALQRFAEVLDTSPTIAYHVRDVVVTQKKSQFCTWEDLHLLDATLALLSRLPNLSQLTLDGLWFGGPAEDTSDAYKPAPYLFPSVRSLVISTCSFQAFTDVQNLCSAFPALRSVHFDGIWWGHWMAVGQRTRARTEPLRIDKGALRWKELNLGSCFSRNAVIEWLLDCLTEDTLLSLRLPLIGAYDSRLKDLLTHVGHNLRCLEVGCPSTSAGHVQDIHDGAPTSLSSLLNLSSCTSLQTLTLTIPTYRDAGFITRWLVTLLVQVASSPLEELRFAVHPILRADVADASAMLTAFDWDLITRVLLGYPPNPLSRMSHPREITQGPSRAHAGRFMSLRKVTFYAGQAADYVHIPSAFVPLAPYLRKLASTSFHSLQEKGIQVCFEA